MKKGENSKIARGAVVIGDVTLGKDVGIWYNAVLRADVGPITVGDYSNVQDCAVVHLDYAGAGSKTTIGKYVTVGHGAIIHGCTIKDNVIVGMGAVILNGAVVEENCIIGAGAVVTQNKVIPAGSMVMGCPAKVIRQLSEEEIGNIKWNAEHYVKMCKEIEEE